MPIFNPRPELGVDLPEVMKQIPEDERSGVFERYCQAYESHDKRRLLKWAIRFLVLAWLSYLGAPFVDCASTKIQLIHSTICRY